MSEKIVAQRAPRDLMTCAFLTLTEGQGHTLRSKVTDVDVSAFNERFLVKGFNILVSAGGLNLLDKRVIQTAG